MGFGACCAPSGLHAGSRSYSAPPDYLTEFHQNQILNLRQHFCAEVISPYAGALPLRQFQQASVGNSGEMQKLKLATFNLGRLGCSHLGTGELLLWRLRGVAIELSARRIQCCILPGARIPPGALLPGDFPFSYFGLRTSSWGSVGVFLATEYEACFMPLDDFCEDRVFWFSLNVQSGEMGSSIALQIFLLVSIISQEVIWRRGQHF